MKYKMPKWAEKQIRRFDRGGMVEDICKKHGCGHPNEEWMNSEKNKRADGSLIDTGIHGCCGCCGETNDD